MDPGKDQTYFLASIPPGVLHRLLFPLGGMTKTQVRKKAEELRLITADKHESQELCFAHDLDYRNAIEAGEPGEIVTAAGALLGRHTGLTHYTIGQRRGLGLSGGPFYVTGLDVENNRVVVGREEDLFAQESGSGGDQRVPSARGGRGPDSSAPLPAPRCGSQD